ncbi:transmembrane protein, putative [Bodo saltans]|uniref:Transmembrane protein, putative n=1 Tax=Bodo saltans TaxID=75058 RepID=A0A0S4KGL8_BODSA|nr:transmembrane protein, putative [Bodo saltans]|eukprot:CUI14818.1 transmembrane protein, putative [Bodo saltans]
MRITDRIAHFPSNTSMSFSSQGGSSTQLPFATLSVEGVPLSVGAASYFSKENAGPDSSLIFVEQPSNCDNPLVQVGGVKVAAAPAKENPSATVFSATPQFPAALVHPCYSNGSLKATLGPPAGHLSDAPQVDDFFYIPLDPMLWTTKSIAQITSVVLLPIDEGTINPVESRVDISSSSQIFELQRTSLSSPINITLQVSDIAVNAVGGVDEEEPAFFLYLGAEVVDAPSVTSDSGEVAGGSSANWFPCNASRVHIFGQADSISSDLRQHTFQDVRILGDIIPVNAETKTAKHVRLCVEFSTTQSSASLMPKTHFSSILTVINPCGVACDLQGGECLTTPSGDRCVCKSLFTGSDCSLLCPTTVASEGVREVCSGAGTCGVDLLSPSRNDGVTSSMCYCDGHRSGALCEIEEISQVFALSSVTSVVAAPTDVSWVGPLVLQSGASISATLAELRVTTSATSESIALLIAPDPISVLSSTSACKYASALISLLDDQTNQSTVIGTIPLALTTSLLAEWVVLPATHSSSTLALRVQLVGAAYPSSPDAYLRCVVSAGLVTLDPTHSTLPWLASSSPNSTTLLLRVTNTTVYQCGTSPSSCRVVYGIVVAIACLVTLLCFMMVVRLKHRISLLEWR